LKTEGEDYAFAAVETVYSEDPTHSCMNDNDGAHPRDASED